MQHLFGKELFDAVIDSIDGFRFGFIEAHRRDSENVEKSGVDDKRVEWCPICNC